LPLSAMGVSESNKRLTPAGLLLCMRLFGLLLFAILNEHCSGSENDVLGGANVVDSIRLLQSSGRPDFDAAGEQMVRSSMLFPAPKEGQWGNPVFHRDPALYARSQFRCVALCNVQGHLANARRP
jgi:hypothetical protein